MAWWESGGLVDDLASLHDQAQGLGEGRDVRQRVGAQDEQMVEPEPGGALVTVPTGLAERLAAEDQRGPRINPSTCVP
ncbi:hypothetical protein ACWDKQ_11930 [Saccharopolyspora sp. NPDC000995]